MSDKIEIDIHELAMIRRVLGEAKLVSDFLEKKFESLPRYPTQDLQTPQVSTQQ